MIYISKFILPLSQQGSPVAQTTDRVAWEADVELVLLSTPSKCRVVQQSTTFLLKLLLDS